MKFVINSFLAASLLIMTMPTHSMDAPISNSSGSDIPTVTKAVNTINIRAAQDPEYNKWINEPSNLLQTIKEFALVFNTSDSTVCRSLTIKEAERRRTIQNLLYDLCFVPKTSFQDLQLFESLVAQGVDVNYTLLLSGKIMTPLSTAIQHGNIKMMRLLLQTGADPNITTSVGNPALTEAMKQTDKTFLKELIPYIQNNPQNTKK